MLHVAWTINNLAGFRGRAVQDVGHETDTCKPVQSESVAHVSKHEAVRSQAVDSSIGSTIA
jgi:hypothetical protein